jgi:hypothetical protein
VYLQQVGGFLRVHHIPPSIKLTRRDIAEILLKVVLNNIALTAYQPHHRLALNYHNNELLIFY